MTRRLTCLALTLAALASCARGPAKPVYVPATEPIPRVRDVPRAADAAHGGSERAHEAPAYETPSYEAPAAYDERAPLHARLEEGAGGLAVRLNRPAHVAIFEVVPGRGMGLMYPAYGDDPSWMSAGYSHVHFTGRRPYTWYHDGGAWSSTEGPRYYLLVASRAPLWIEDFQDDPGARHGWAGLRRLAVHDPNRAMNELVDRVVPPQDDLDWDTDLLTVWPRETQLALDERRPVRVVCDDGYVVTTTWDTAHLACRRFQGSPSPPSVPPQRPDTLDAPPSDSVRVPTRRRPEPRSADDERGRGTDDSTGVRVAPPQEPAPVERWRTPEAPAPATPERVPPAAPVGRPEPAPSPATPLPVPQPEVPPREEPAEQPRREEPRREEPRREEPRREEPRREEPRREEPQREEPRREEPRREEPAREEERPAPTAEPGRAEPPPTAPVPMPQERSGDPR